jgi:hypothetical protein
MALVVEDGTGVAGANVYADVAAADLWYADLADTAWAALTVAAKETALIQGCRYCDNQQIYPLASTKTTAIQSLQWPRPTASYWGGEPLIPPNVVPVEVVRANIVAAGLYASGSLPSADQGGLQVIREKVDVLEVQYAAPQNTTPEVIGATTLTKFGHPAVTGLLLPFLRADVLTDSTTGTTVSRLQASRRATWYQPASQPSSFSRGQFDKVPLSEDAVMKARTAGTIPPDPTVP